jgi:hypothetical protein
MPTELDQVYKEQREKRTTTLLGLPEGFATEEAQEAVADVERKVVNLPPETGLVPLQGPTDEEKLQRPTPQDRPDLPLGAMPTVARADFDEREFSMVENIKQFGTGVVTGTEGLAAGVGGTIEAFGGLVSMIEEAADTPEGEGAGEFFEGIGADTWQRASGLMGAAAPSLLAAMTTAKITGNTTAAAALLGMLEGMPMYAEAREAGQGRGFALAAAGLATTAITFLEKTGLDEAGSWRVVRLKALRKRRKQRCRTLLHTLAMTKRASSLRVSVTRLLLVPLPVRLLQRWPGRKRNPARWLKVPRPLM